MLEFAAANVSTNFVHSCADPFAFERKRLTPINRD